VNRLAALFRRAFGAIPSSALKMNPRFSEREAFNHALLICSTIVGLAVMEIPEDLKSVKEDRSDLDRIFHLLRRGMIAIQDRDRGLDEPLFRPTPRSPRMPRESQYDQFVKSLSAAACYTLIKFGVSKKHAADEIADLLTKDNFLGRKSRNQSSAVGRSILNWMARWERGGDLHYFGTPDILFKTAYDLVGQGRGADVARRGVLHSLKDHLNDLKRSFGN
jgi:hypothetical protein